MADRGAAGQITFFHYQDGSGKDVIVTDLEDVPVKYRGHMEILDEDSLTLKQQTLDMKAADLLQTARATATTGGARSFLGVDGPSFALGFVLAFCLGFFVWSGRGGNGARSPRARLVVKLVVAVAGVVVMSGLYLGFVLRAAGLGAGGVVATPADAIHEARAAVDKANAATAAQQDALDKLDR